MYTFKPLTFTKHEFTSNLNPKPRSGHRIVCNDTFVYSFGGFNPKIEPNDVEMSYNEIWRNSSPLFKEIWKFNIATNEWHLMKNQQNLPNELASMAVVLQGNMLIIHGGSGCPFGEHNSNETYFCNVFDESFSKPMAIGELPEPQYGQAVVTHGNFLYTIGGTNGFDYTCDIHRLDLRTIFWESVYICSGKEQGEPAGRYRHEVAFDGRRIFVLGGGTGDDAYPLNTLPTFDVVEKKWTNLETIEDLTDGFPSPRRCHGVVQYKDERTGAINVVISGGLFDHRPLSDLWKLNLQTLRWSRLPEKIPLPVYFHSTTITPSGCMYTFGGIVKKTGPENSESIERTDEVYSIWLVIPSLTEICWLALNHYCPKLKKVPNSKLLTMGIPFKYIKRLRGIPGTS